MLLRKLQSVGTWTFKSSSKTVKKILAAQTNINKQLMESHGLNSNEITTVWVHEIGHILGFAETNDGTVSVMKQDRGRNLGWSNYWLPQTHDINDIRTFYKDLKL